MEKTVKANAKINLYLNVSGKREDGYHEIETVMQEISLCDEVSVRITENSLGCNRITLSSNDSRVPLNEKNIAHKCAAKFLEFTKITGLDVHIHIEKRIPISGGLAGGSTDGAAVLKLLGRIFPRTSFALSALRSVRTYRSALSEDAVSAEE